MTRKLTLIYELPEELCQVLEQKANTERRCLEDVVAEHLAAHRRPRPAMTAAEIDRRKAAFDRHLGEWDSGNPKSSENEQIDADLAREYGKQ